MYRKVLKTRRYKAGYEVRTEEVSMPENPTVIVKSAYTPKGDYIGDPKLARFLIVKMGISPEKSENSDSICSIGFCNSKNKWYGWSHRAICGFGIGDKIFEEAFGDDTTLFVNHGNKDIENLDDARIAAINFADSVS